MKKGELKIVRKNFGTFFTDREWKVVLIIENVWQDLYLYSICRQIEDDKAKNERYEYRR